MSLELLRQAAHRTVGINETEKAVLKGEALSVYIAADADRKFTKRLYELCNANGLTPDATQTMAALGQAADIKVKAAAAAILKD